MKKFFCSLLLLIALAICSPAQAAEGEFEFGGALLFDFVPSEKIYGGGADIFLRYQVIDSLKVALSFQLSANHRSGYEHVFGLYRLRFGAIYDFDIIAWVPIVGAYLSTLFSEYDYFQWQRDDFGLGLDLELGLAYKGFRPYTIALTLGYHIYFTKMKYLPDFFSLGLSLSWTHDNF